MTKTRWLFFSLGLGFSIVAWLVAFAGVISPSIAIFPLILGLLLLGLSGGLARLQQIGKIYNYFKNKNQR
jgi:hypothetical protein